ncbi:DNA-binding protein [Pseudomonas sp. NY15181]|uniref:helix-turn-helix domain-containing transcriptional regulator n=1 Tax=Pseudomonas sp. NY15181 TaxID=3400349 RepID=UPI003A8A6194
MTIELREFDTSAYLDNEELIAEYLAQVLADGDSDELLVAITNIAKARSTTKTARD